MKKVFSLLLSIVMLFSITVGLDFSVYAANYYESEDNGSYYSADILSVNSTISGNINDSSDKDYYKIVAPSNGKISISFNHSYENRGDDWNVYVYKYANGEYTELSYANIDLNSNESIKIPYIGAVKNGVYYIKVERCCSGVIGKNYSIKLSFSQSNYYEKEVNDVYSTATNVLLNNSYSGNINSNYDKDYYKIVAPSNGKISISFNHLYENSSDDWNVYVYKYANGEYTELSYANIDLNSNESIKIPYIGAVKNGVYYIKVERCCSGVIGKNYSIKLSFSQSNYYEKEVNDVYSTATNVLLNNSYSGNINNDYDKDYYKIVAPSNGKISISFNHSYENSSDDWNVYVYKYTNGEYTELSYTNIDLNSSKSISIPYIGAVKNGVYYIKVERCCSGVIGKNYTLNIVFRLSAPANFRVTSRKTSSLKLAWNKASGVTGYQLQRKVGGNYKHITYTSNNYYTVKNLSSATSYAFRVRAYKTINGKRYYSSWITLTTPTKPSKVSIKTPSTNSEHQIIVNWKALPRGSGYQVQYSRKKNFSSVIATKNVSGKTKTSYTGNNFTKGKTYYVRVRAYKTVNGKKYYGPWSSVKSIKCK